MANVTAHPKKDLDIWQEIFTQDQSLYRQSFYFFGVLAGILIFATLLSFFFYFLTESTQPPENVKITNITDSSVTVTWKTEKPTLGLVVYTLAQTPKILRPIALLSIPSNNRSLDGFKGLSTLHSVTLSRLYPNTSYLYRISTGLHTYKIDLDGHILPDLKTAPTLSSLSSPNPIYGQVMTKNNQDFAKNSLVNLTVFDNEEQISTTLSSITNSNGYYIFDLTTLRTLDLKNNPDLPPSAKIALTVNGDSLGTGESLLTIDDLSSIAPITLK